MKVGVRRIKQLQAVENSAQNGQRRSRFAMALNESAKVPVTLPKVRIQEEPWKDFLKRCWQ